jgi:HSP20 family protein
LPLRPDKSFEEVKLMLGLSRGLFDDLFSLHRDIDRLFEQTMGPSRRWLSSGNGQNTFVPDVESYTNDGKIVYRMAIPGVDPKDVDLSLTGRQVTIRGERKAPADVNDDKWYVRGFHYGQFEHSFTLPEAVEVDQLNATFNHGMLEITVPVSKAHLPRRIQIKELSSSEERPQLKSA